MDAHKLGPDQMDCLEDPARADRLPTEDVIELLDPQPGMRCLDLGAGTGYLARPLAAAIDPGVVVGVDRSRRMLHELRRRARQADVAVHPVRGVAAQLPFHRATFGRILSVNLHHEVDDRETMFAEVVRVLEQGGRILVVDWAPTETTEGPPVEHRVPAETIAAELEHAGFQQVDVHDVFEHHSAVTARRSTRP